MTCAAVTTKFSNLATSPLYVSFLCRILLEITFEHYSYVVLCVLYGGLTFHNFPQLPSCNILFLSVWLLSLVERAQLSTRMQTITRSARRKLNVTILLTWAVSNPVYVVDNIYGLRTIAMFYFVARLHSKSVRYLVQWDLRSLETLTSLRSGRYSLGPSGL